MSSWVPEGGWIAITVVVTACAILVGALAAGLAGRRGAEAARWVAVAYVLAASAAAAARIWLATSRGRGDLDVAPIVIGFGLAGLAAPALGRTSRARAGAALAPAAACMLVVAVVANLEPPS